MIETHTVSGIDNQTSVVHTLTVGDYQMSVCSYGGALMSIIVPDQYGRKANVLLELPSVAAFQKTAAYINLLIGRFANRIAHGTFTIDGTSYQIPCNERGVNALHGGGEGFHCKQWKTLTSENDDHAAVHLSYFSKDGEMGFPGNLQADVDYVLYDSGRLEVTYSATCDQVCPVNLTNHAYFNLAGDGTDVLDHEMQLFCDAYLPVNEHKIPTGEIASVTGTPFDFTTAKRIGKDMGALDGYDHCMVLAEKGDELKPCAYVKEHKSGRTMRVSTTMEGVQFYTGNNLKGLDVSPEGNPYTRHTGFCLETQHFPNAMNEEHFPDCLLRPGEIYRHTTVFEFNV